jgi:arylformamidase
MTRLVDVSLTLGPGTLVWPGDPAIDIEPTLRISRGDSANVSEIRLGTHSGTHVDPPVHFIDGTPGIDRLSLDRVFGDALVLDLAGVREPIEPPRLEALDIPRGVTRVLLRTANSELWRRSPVTFPESYACLTPDAARWIVDRGIQLVGIDFLSIEQKGAAGHPVHHTLLEKGVVIVEGLDLFYAEAGPYKFVCLPLKIEDGDGGPARAALIVP